MQTCENCGGLNPNKIQICEFCGEEISSAYLLKHSDYEDLVVKLENEDRNNILKISLNHQDEDLKYYDNLSRDKTFTYLHKQYPDKSTCVDTGYNVNSYNKIVREEFNNFINGSYLKPSKITIILIIFSIIFFLYYLFKY